MIWVHSFGLRNSSLTSTTPIRTAPSLECMSTPCRIEALSFVPSACASAPSFPLSAWVHPEGSKAWQPIPSSLQSVSVCPPSLLQCMSASWRPEGPTTHSIPSEWTSVPLLDFSSCLSAWTHYKALNDPLHSFMLWKCTLLVCMPIFSCMQVIFMFSFIVFHDLSSVIALCTWFTSIVA